jgi:hypothetical protein
VVETLLPPIIDNDYDYSVLENGIAWTAAAGVGVLSYLTLQYLSRRGAADIVLLINGLAFFFAGLLTFSAFPWDTSDVAHMFVLDRDIPMPKARFVAGLFCVVLGFTHSDAVSLSVYSKWIDAGSGGGGGGGHGSSMGNLMAVQAVACMVGPIIGTQSYAVLDRNIFFVMSAVIGLSLAIGLAVWRPIRARDRALAKLQAAHAAAAAQAAAGGGGGVGTDAKPGDGGVPGGQRAINDGHANGHPHANGHGNGDVSGVLNDSALSGAGAGVLQGEASFSSPVHSHLNASGGRGARRIGRAASPSPAAIAPAPADALTEGHPHAHPLRSPAADLMAAGGPASNAEPVEHDYRPLPADEHAAMPPVAHGPSD